MKGYLKLSVVSFVLFQVLGGFALSCNDVLAAGSGASFETQDLTALRNITKDEIQGCIAHLGKDKLQEKQAQAIWSALVNVYEYIEEIPETVLQDLGWISLGVSPPDFYNMSLSEPDTVAAFGKYRGLSLNQLKALKEAIFQQWDSKTLQDMTSYDLAAFGHILCSFNTSEITLIHPDSYRDAAGELRSLQGCPLEVLSELANLAVNSQAFGDPSFWSYNQVSAVGCIMTGLPSVSVIPPQAMEGLTLDSVSCLCHKVLQEMTPAQLSMLSPFVAKSLSEGQKSALSSDQLDSLMSAIDGSHSSGVTFPARRLVAAVLSLVLGIGVTL